MRTFLLTGFGPFGPHLVNPSWEVVRRLDGAPVGPFEVRVARLDVAYARAASQLEEAISAHAPDVLLSLGVAPGGALRVERRAHNADDSKTADVLGEVGGGRPIREGGPALLETRLPVAKILAALDGAGFEARPSDDAGGYLCNHVFYVGLDRMAADRPAGFLHVPPLEGGWDLDRLEGALRVVLETIAAEAG